MSKSDVKLVGWGWKPTTEELWTEIPHWSDYKVEDAVREAKKAGLEDIKIQRKSTWKGTKIRIWGNESKKDGK